MANTKHTVRSVVLSANESAYVVGDLLREKEEHKEDLEFVSALNDLQEIGRGKGIIYSPSEGEKITFDSYEESVIIVRTSSYEGRTIHQLNVLVKSSLVGDTELALAIFRRKPGLKDNLDELLKNKLAFQLLQNYIGDLKRLEMLAGKTWLVKKEHRWPRREFARGKDGKVTEVDVATLPEESRRLQSFYILEPVK
jgi:hypothetical protein